VVGVVLVIAVQLLVPAWGLFRETPRFGWQMYAGGWSMPEFTMIGSGGTRRVVQSSDFVANERPEVRYEHHLPPLLCDRFPDTRYVLVRSESPPLRGRYSCSDG
jgi:hypothetical protein